MLSFVKKNNGDVIHNVGMLQKFMGSDKFTASIVDGFGKIVATVEINAKDISLVSSYQFINNGLTAT